MSEHIDIFDAEFFAEQGTAKAIRKEVGAWIGRYVAATGKSHSFAWRKAYLLLEEGTGFRGPAKKTLDAVEKAGLLETLLAVVKRLESSGIASVSVMRQPIPEPQPHLSDRERTGCFPPWTASLSEDRQGKHDDKE